MPKSRTLPSRSKAHVLRSYRSRGKANRNLWLVYSQKTNRDWILNSDRHLVHWAKYLETNPDVRTFVIQPDGIEASHETGGPPKNVDASAELGSGELEYHVLNFSATLEQGNSSFYSRYSANDGRIRIFSEADLFPLGEETMRWVKLLNYCAAIRDEMHSEATLACIAAMRQIDKGTLGQVIQQLPNFDSQIVIGIFSRMVIKNDIFINLASSSFNLMTQWTWRDRNVI